MQSAAPVTLARPPVYALAPVSALGLRDTGRRLRSALYWATETLPDWRDACAGLNFDLVLPSFAPARLQADLPEGGCVLVQIERGKMLHFVRIETHHTQNLRAVLPARFHT